jgi:adenine-specific DNA-methyltransferase
MKESEAILGTGAFNYPKPSDLITLILKEFVDKDSIILDAFAGTGTTGHAVLKLNNQDNGRRQFILVEVEDYADKITAERIRRVSAGYIETGSGLHVKGLGGKFDYFEVHKDL